MLKTPILMPPTPIDATGVQTIKFGYSGQNQAMRNNLVIESLSGEQIYNQIQNTFSLSHNVPANTLVNGQTYRMKVRVGDINNNWSNFSDLVIFYTLSSPTLSIDNIDEQGRVYNQTWIFETSYLHPDNELLQSYRYFLYDFNQNLKTAFSEVFSDGSEVLTQEITGLNNGERYYVEVRTLSVKGQTATTGKIQFIPFYAAPQINGVLEVANVPTEGAIKLNLSAKQVLFKLYDDNGNLIDVLDVGYVEDTKIDMNRLDYTKLVTDDGFRTETENFVFQIWFENIVENETLFKIYSPLGWMDVNFYGDRFHCFKHYYQNNVVAHFVSNEVVINEQITLFIKQLDGLMDMIAE